jgi:DNA-nicking Smr family endonuclease
MKAMRELDLHGLDRTHAMTRIRRFIQDSQRDGVLNLRIIHGIGKGVLRDMTRKLLDNHPSVYDFGQARPVDGGTGATVVRLRSKNLR